MIIHSLTKNTENTYIYRAYEEFYTPRYKFAMPVSYRGNGLFECHAWNTVKLLWPEIGLTFFAKVMEWIELKLIEIDKRFKNLMGTFEADRLIAYSRLFRSAYVLETLYSHWKVFNSTLILFTYVKFIHYLFGYKQQYKYMWE